MNLCCNAALAQSLLFLKRVSTDQRIIQNLSCFWVQKTNSSFISALVGTLLQFIALAAIQTCSAPPFFASFLLIQEDECLQFRFRDI